MRLLFLSDTHAGLDLSPRPRGRRPAGVDGHLERLRAGLAPARAGAVDAVLHGGDLLYRSKVPAWLAEAALAPLREVADLGVPVLLVPGNHERGRVPYPLLARHERLLVFDRPRSFTIEAGGLRVAFGGFPYAAAVRARFPALVEETGLARAEADVRLVCLHHCVEGATCGPGDFTFTTGDDVVRRRDLPAWAAAVLSGHIHRCQVLPGEPPVVYAGSTERTSRAEADEPKGVLTLEVGRRGVDAIAFSPLGEREGEPP
ncbi:MAG: metallophosphoesterase [Anaeromyxobacter sp.]